MKDKNRDYQNQEMTEEQKEEFRNILRKEFGLKVKKQNDRQITEG